MTLAARNLIGAAGRTFVIPIEAGKVRELARATFAAASAYNGTPGALSPPTYLSSAPYLWGDSWEEPGDSPMAAVAADDAQLIHGGEEITFYGHVPRVGDQLVAITTIDDVTYKQRGGGDTMTVIVQRTSFKDARGAMVADVRSTVLVLPPTDGNRS